MVVSQTIIYQLASFLGNFPFGEAAAAFFGAYFAFKLGANAEKNKEDIRALTAINFIQLQILGNRDRILQTYKNDIRENIKEFENISALETCNSMVHLLPNFPDSGKINASEVAFFAISLNKDVLVDIGKLNEAYSQICITIAARNDVLAPFYHPDHLGKKNPSRDTLIYLHNLDVNLRGYFGDYLFVLEIVCKKIFNIGKSQLPKEVTKDTLIKGSEPREEYTKIEKEILDLRYGEPKDKVRTRFVTL